MTTRLSSALASTVNKRGAFTNVLTGTDPAVTQVAGEQLLAEHVDEGINQYVAVTVDPSMEHGDVQEEDREGKGRGEKSLDRKAVALVVQDSGDGEQRSSEVRVGEDERQITMSDWLRTWVNNSGLNSGEYLRASRRRLHKLPATAGCSAVRSGRVDFARR